MTVIKTHVLTHQTASKPSGQAIVRIGFKTHGRGTKLWDDIYGSRIHRPPAHLTYSMGGNW